MWVIVGLGNPGSRYERTRHNAGFLVADRLCARGGFSCDRSQFGCEVGAGELGGQRAVVAKPQLYMNRSGHPVRSVLGFYKVPLTQVLIVHDDMDLPFGDLRLKVGGGHGGHNGLRDLHEHLGGGAYARLRFGVGRPPEGWDPADYVLSRWSASEDAALPELLDTAAGMVQSVLDHGLSKAMNTHNTRKKAERAPREPGPEREAPPPNPTSPSQ